MPEHTFQLEGGQFLLDGKPFQIHSGELHPSRIPKEYWRHRIQMAKAMGLNTISIYTFWNDHERKEGKWDFKSGSRDLAEFIRLVKEEGMWLLLRPGPYSCAEWDFGGIPPYLLKYPDLKVRCMDPHYIHGAENYLSRIAKIAKPFQISEGGPILMIQLENEYGSFGNDRNYMKWLHDFWVKQGFKVPFFTADGATTYMLEAGTYPGAAVGLDPLTNLDQIKLAHRYNPGVPVFCSETYPGWLTHWGEEWARVSADDCAKNVRFYLDNKLSFSLYMIHGGTNFGFTAGANNGGKGYEPHVTSYDYDAPIDEQGRANPKYMAIRGEFEKGGTKLPPIPGSMPAMSIPAISMKAYSSIWNRLPKAVELVQPKPFESLGLYQGMAIYRTKLIGHKSGKLTVKDLHDFGVVLVDGKFVGTLDRREGRMSIDLPAAQSEVPTLEILVEGMGHINFAADMIDRKGITDRVTLNGMTLMNWDFIPLPLYMEWVNSLKPGEVDSRPGKIFSGEFRLESTADTFFEMTGYQKGYVWVNGHNLGRYWSIGPQKRLFCPAGWLNKGFNQILVLDLLGTQSAPISSFETLE
ncbi:MAG: beta-galactosidase [Armatimonadetes bacterium]|nr:beta-galactosidase [Armatimonadota bacterium]